MLRALRPELPEALFFTTDFDETLTMGSELGWTHNLIVASSFGPELRQDIQDEIPPFRGAAFAGFVAQIPFSRLSHEIAADRETTLGVILKQHADQEGPLGIVKERALVIAVSDVEITERCRHKLSLPSPRSPNA